MAKLCPSKPYGMTGNYAVWDKRRVKGNDVLAGRAEAVPPKRL
jgi:hypothetical protein